MPSTNRNEREVTMDHDTPSVVFEEKKGRSIPEEAITLSATKSNRTYPKKTYSRRSTARENQFISIRRSIRS